MLESEQVGSGDRLSFTLFLAAALHGMLIFGIGFKLNSGEKIAPTLNVTLATHQSHREPEKADFLAQLNQQASGSSNQVKELTARQRAKIADTRIRDLTPVPQQMAATTGQRESRVLTTQADARRQVKAPSEAERDAREKREGQEEEAPLVNPEIASLQAKLDRIRQDLANRPRIRRLTSVSTKSSVDAAYLNSWAEKIEEVGNRNFPEQALRQKLFGELRLSVSLYPNGTVSQVEILQSSGHPILDDAAVQIVRLAAPFPPFPPEIRKSTDLLEVIRTWRFEIRGLSTSASPDV